MPKAPADSAPRSRPSRWGSPTRSPQRADGPRNYSERHASRSPSLHDSRGGRDKDGYRQRHRRRSRSRSPSNRPSASSPPPLSSPPPPAGSTGTDPPVAAERPTKIQPNFGLSGKLAADTNTVNGTIVDYNEPPESRQPTDPWRLYVFKGDVQVDILPVGRQSAYLFGRDRKVADIPVDHPSCSKQHAVLQYRQVPTRAAPKSTVADYESGLPTAPCTEVRPYLIDLKSSNGTFVNGEQLPSVQYYELRHQDVIKFAFSSREYVLIREN